MEGVNLEFMKLRVVASNSGGFGVGKSKRECNEKQ
jgi:hypothetical protein